MRPTELIQQCGRYPSLSELSIDNLYWQVLETSSNGTIKMFNAFYDARKHFENDPVIRILSFISQMESEVVTFCQLWFDGIKEPQVVEVFEYRILWRNHWEQNKVGPQPYLIGCKNPLANQNLIPSSVSLVENRCDHAENKLDIIYNLPEVKHKKPFAVCVKHSNFKSDESMKIIEWIEILLLLGVNKIFIYVIKLHPNMIKTLTYYETLGKVKIEMMTLISGLPEKDEHFIQWFQNQMISLNDCLYKNMYQYDYLVPLDVDEIIMPKRPEDKTWKDLLIRAIVTGRVTQNETYSAYSVRNTFFLPNSNQEQTLQSDVPANMNFLPRIYRSVNFTKAKSAAKSFQDTERIYSMHNHFPMECIGKAVIDFLMIDENDGQLQHYRKNCNNYPKEECEDFKNNVVKDLSLWKHKNEILQNVNRTLKALNELHPDLFEVQIV